MIAPATFDVDPADLPALREFLAYLAALGYREDRVKERLGVADLKDLNWRALPIYRATRLAAREPLDLAIDLFLLQGTTTELLSSEQQALLVRAGLLEVQGGRAYARASLYPVSDQILVSDHAWPQLPHPGIAEVPHDQVMFVGTDSRWLARFTARRSMEAALDLCTGSGIHAVLAAAHARRVVAVDINPRAAACTRLNAALAGTTHLEVAVGDLCAPVQGQRFDLITANPPFVPSPVDDLGYRDGGRSGNDVHQRLIAELPAYLAPGGTAQIVTELGEGEDWTIADRLREWLGDAPMDVVVFRLHEVPAAAYATGHAQGDRDYGEFLTSVGDWYANLRAQGYVRVVSVLLAFRWSTSGAPWIRMESSEPPTRDVGPELDALFAAERQAHDPDLARAILQGTLRRAGPIGLMEGHVLGADLHATARARLLGQAMLRDEWLEPAEREVLGLLEAPRPFKSLAADSSLEPKTTLDAVASLLRRGLVALEPTGLVEFFQASPLAGLEWAPQQNGDAEVIDL